MNVSRLGAKVYEQCAGFLRIPGAANPLDNTAVHPERYALVEKMASDAGVPVSRFVEDAGVRAGVDLKRYVSPEAGMPTLGDIMAELAKRGRDPRGSIHVFEFSQEIKSIEDVEVGMILPCIVTNVTAFGAFVGIDGVDITFRNSANWAFIDAGSASNAVFANYVSHNCLEFRFRV